MARYSPLLAPIQRQQAATRLRDSYRQLGDEAQARALDQLVREPRGRRVRRLLSRAMRIVSAQRDRIVATVHTAAPLSAPQRDRLRAVLTGRYGRQIALNEVLDSAVVGGLRVQVADDVIDGSISARLADLRHKLAG